MVSRDTIVHLAAVALALLVLLVASYFELGVGEGPIAIAVILLFYGLTFGGAHLYLAVRGEDGIVPAAARWRYVAMLAVLLGAGAASLYGGSETVATVELGTIALAVGLVTVAVYLVTESLAGYRESRPE